MSFGNIFWGYIITWEDILQEFWFYGRKKYGGGNLLISPKAKSKVKFMGEVKVFSRTFSFDKDHFFLQFEEKTNTTKCTILLFFINWIKVHVDWSLRWSSFSALRDSNVDI